MAEIHTGQPGNTPFKENWHNKQITMEEEAKRLVERFDETLTYLESKSKAKQCAKICVEEILKSDPLNPSGKFESYEQCEGKAYDYWNGVLKEIDKL